MIKDALIHAVFNLSYAYIIGLTFIITIIRSLFTGRTSSNKIEKLVIIERIALDTQVAITPLLAFSFFAGIMMNDSEMIIVSSINYLNYSSF